MTATAPTLAIFVDGRKFMWDGGVHPTREDAVRARDRYLEQQFDVRLVEVETAFLLYTRRVVNQAAAEAQT